MTALKAIRMPKWGLSMEEGTVVGWLKQQGDHVAEGDELVEIETTKITNVMEATQAGILACIVAQPGTMLEVGQPIAVISDGPVASDELDAFIAGLATTPEETDAEPEAGLETRKFQVSGREINTGVAGSADPTIVLIHGFAGDLNNWSFNIDALAARARVVAIDLPGHGASSKDVGDGSLPLLASVVAAVLDELQVKGATVVGHSLGAAVAERLSLDRADLVGSLVLVCPAGAPGTTLSSEFLTAITDAQKARDVRAALTALVADPDSIGADMVDGMLRYKRIDGVPAALATIRDRLLAGTDLAAVNDRLGEMPAALVIASHADRIVGTPDEASLPKSWQCTWIDEAGHMPQLERAAEVNTLILSRVGGG